MRTILVTLMLGMLVQAAQAQRESWPVSALLQSTPAQRQALARAEALETQAINLYKKGEAARAIPLAKQAVAIRKQVQGEKHSDYTYSLNNLAFFYHIQGDHRTAIPLFQQVVANYKQTHGEKSYQYATAISNLATCYMTQGDHRVALPLFKQALAIRKQSRGEKHPDYAQSLQHLATVYNEMGDYRSALPLFKQGLAIYKQAVGEKDPQYITALNNLAELYQRMGDHRSALPLYQQVLALHKEVLGEKHPDYASSLNNLALLYRSMGDHRSALPLFQQALALYKQTLGEKHPHYAQSLNNIAALYQSMGEHRLALPLFRQALALRKEVLGEKHPSYATTLNNLALLYCQMGDHKAALPLYQEVLAIDRQALGERHPLYANSLHNLALLYLEMKEYRLALPLYWQALAIRKQTQGENHPLYTTTLSGLVEVYTNQGRVGAALLLSEQATFLTRQQLLQDAAVQSERQQLAAVEALHYRLGQRFSIPEESPQFSHNHVLTWKGSTFAAQVARRQFLMHQADPSTQNLALQLREVTQSLSLLRERSDEGSRKRARQLYQQKEDLEVQLAERSTEFRLALKPPRSTTYRDSLPAGTVLLDFLVYKGVDPAKPLGEQKSERRLAVWVVRPRAEMVRIDLGPMKTVDADIEAWRSDIKKCRDGLEIAQRLRRQLWDPLEKYLEGAKVVLLSPDETLGRLPFAALPGRKAGQFLIEEVPLAILPVPQALEQMLQRPTSKPSLLTVGGVDYGVGTRALWTFLPGTLIESKEVASRFRSLFKGEVTAFSGTRATKAAVRTALPNHRYAHFATHGYFDPTKLVPSSKVAGASKLLGREGVTSFDPNLVSGLVFAGANKPTLGDDGILTASEVAELDLSGVELAVLSACETGRGKEAGGEGTLGLQRAFAMSGCKTVLSSLWEVDDAATSILIERFFYHLWEKKLSKIEALRLAQLEVLRRPEWVEERALKLRRAVKGELRAEGKKVVKEEGGRKVVTSPIVWWAAWQLSGDWR